MARVSDKVKALAKTEEEDVVSSLPTLAEPEPETKAAHCDVCNERFLLAGEETTCPSCVAKAATRRSSSRAGFVRCRVVTLGSVKAHGYASDGSLKVEWHSGDEGEFSKADAESLPEALVVVDG